VRDAPRGANVAKLRDWLPESFGKPDVRQMHAQGLEEFGSMSMRKIAALLASLLLVAVLANAASQKDTIRIKVLDSVTRALAP